MTIVSPHGFALRQFLALLLWVGLPCAGAVRAEPVSAPDQADLFACTALEALDFSDSTGAEVRLAAVGNAPAERDLPTVCRVTGAIAPQVGFELRMPVRDWNGKLLVTGCSNLCGVLEVQAMEDALIRGYATATTDMGHRTGDTSDARWAYNNKPLEIDFGYRATHVTTLAAKEIVASYYGDKPAYSYFRGCSTGGRQGLVAAERYPADFDGIIAGAPFNPALSVPHMDWVMAANTDRAGQPILGRDEFALLGKAVLDSCDHLDGIEDGVISDPGTCTFTPQSLQCAGAAVKACLTPTQVEAAAKIYAGARNSRGEPLYSAGSPVGSEFTWEKSLLAPPGQTPFFSFITRNWSQYLAYEPDPPPGSGPLHFDFDAGPARLAATNEVAGFRPQLERFRALGGRLLLYHGSVDESLMPAHTIDYWRQAERRLGSAQSLAEFARFFVVPGMLHCGGGPGAAEIDYLSALENWVEKGEAPEALIAHKVADSVPTLLRQPRFPLATSRIEFTRPVYPYPDVPIYAGTGDPKSAASFKRVARDATP